MLAACSSSPPQTQISPKEPTHEVVRANDSPQRASVRSDNALVRDTARQAERAAVLRVERAAILQAEARAQEQAKTTTTDMPRVWIGAAAQASPDSSGCVYAGLIRSVWQRDAEWAIGIAFRESRCQAGARNGSSGSAGIFQLLGHQDMLRYACPGQDPSTSWAVPECNVKAAWHLYEGAGRAPWRL